MVIMWLKVYLMVTHNSCYSLYLLYFMMLLVTKKIYLHSQKLHSC